MSSSSSTYRGRFAPSPTGPLHFGSLVAAVASYADARAHHGSWLLRIEDLDAPRERPGAARSIVETLAAFDFEWDAPIVFQSHRTEAYTAAIERLTIGGATYWCGCTRREIADSQIGPRQADLEHRYLGTCRTGLPVGRSRRSMRVRVSDEDIAFEDIVQGRITQSLEATSGDFIIRRADGPFAYQLAVVVDDAEQGVTHVVRGADLLESTPRQIHLQRLLEVPTPAYLHVPVVLDASGNKLSKQTLAAPVDADHPAPALVRALEFLGQHPPKTLASANPRTIWEWTHENWQREHIPRLRGRALT